MIKKKYNICIVTYETTTNPITRNFSKFIRSRYSTDLLYIYHPYLEYKEASRKSSEYEFYDKSKLKGINKSPQLNLPIYIALVKDFILTIYWCLKLRKRWDLYFAAGNLNPLAGIILKRIGVVKKVIYYSMDYYPVRFQNKFLNDLYFFIDKFCVKYSDETWNTSSMIAVARKNKTGLSEKSNNQFTVPGGIWFYETNRLPFGKIDMNKIVYRGTLQDHMGVDLIIKALPLIKKEIPNIRLEILGGGIEEQILKKLVKDLKLSKNVTFHGWIKERDRLEDLIRDGAIGIATFNTLILDDKVKNADPGKIKDYMSFGMPVITTDALFYHKTIEKNKMGIVINYDHKELAQAVIKLLMSKKLLEAYRINSLEYIKDFDWTNILEPNVKRILNE